MSCKFNITPVRFKASAAMIMRFVHFCDIMQGRLLIQYWRFGTNYWPPSSMVRKSKKISWACKKVSIGCLEMSVWNHHSTLRNSLEECIFRTVTVFTSAFIYIYTYMYIHDSLTSLKPQELKPNSNRGLEGLTVLPPLEKPLKLFLGHFNPI